MFNVYIYIFFQDLYVCCVYMCTCWTWVERLTRHQSWVSAHLMLSLLGWHITLIACFTFELK